MKNQSKLNEKNTKSIEFGQCAFPEEIMHEKAFCFAANGTGDFTNKQPLTVSNGNLIPANEGGWKLNTYSDLMKSLEENPQVKTQIHNPAVGFLCTQEYVVLDIDGHGKEGLSDAKKDFVSRYAETTYCEKSLSGNGYHMIFRCDSPITSGKINVDFGEGLGGIEVFGGVECKIHVILTGNSNGKEINHLPDELREKIKEAAKNRDSTKQKTFDSGICNESALLLSKINKSPVDVYCKLFNGTVEEERFKETRCVTNYFEENFGIPAHHFGVKENGEWCLYGNNMKGGSLLEAVAITENAYDFGRGKLKNTVTLSQIKTLAEDKLGISEDKVEITIKNSQTRTPFDTNMLPKWLKDYVDFVQSVSISYPEFNYIGGLQLVSFLAGRMFYYELPWEMGKEQNLSLYALMLGLSGSVKSGAFTNAEKIRELVLRNTLIPSPTTILPKSFSKEAFEVALVGNVPKTAEEKEEQKMNQKNSNGSLWFDECSGFLSQMNGKGGYLASFKEKLMDYWSGQPISIIRKNPEDRTKNIEVISELDTRLSVWLATTFEAFDSAVSLSDMKTGFITRFLVVAPKHKQERIKNRDISKAAEVQKDLVTTLSQKVYTWYNNWCDNNYQPIKINFSVEQINRVDDWYFDTKEGKDDLTVSYLGKLQNYIFKLAALFQILEGNSDYTVSAENFEKAFNLINDYHLQAYLEIAKRVSLNPNRLQSRILKALEDAGGRMSHRDLTRKTSPKNAREFEEAVNMLIMDMGYLKTEGKYYILDNCQ